MRNGFRVGDNVCQIMDAHPGFAGKGKLHGIIEKIDDTDMPLKVRLTKIDDPNGWHFKIGDLLNEKWEHWEVKSSMEHDPLYYEAITEHANG